MKKTILISLLIPFTLLADYTLVAAKRPHSAIDTLPKNKVADMNTIPQDPAFYASQLQPMSKSEQLQLEREFNEKYFKPWSISKIDETRNDIEWPLRSVTQKPIYDKNHRQIDASTYNQWIANSNYDALDTVQQRAITIRHCDVKAFPSTTAYYYNPQKVGEGFPFDYNQNSSFHINTPLYISHYSLDKQWAFVQDSTAFGWVHTSNIALVDGKFIKEFRTGSYAVAIRDNNKLTNGAKTVSLIKLGSLFPVSKGAYLFASKDAKGKAHIERIKAATKGVIAHQPVPFTPQNVAMIAKEFYGEPYGWGGLLQTRDCSAFTKDFFTPFGIFLRRNSSKQAADGAYCSIKGLEKSKKKAAIISKAKPFRSMLYVPGHIVLYLGEYKGEPVIMHSYWGTRLENGSKYVLARNIITTTEPGKELSTIKEKSKLANTLKAIITPGD